MVLYNSEMSKNISFHVALCAKGFPHGGWRKGDSWEVSRYRGGVWPPRPLVLHQRRRRRIWEQHSPASPCQTKGVRFGGRDRGKLRVGSIQAHARQFKPHLEQIKKHTKRTGAFLSKSLFVCSFMRPPPSTLCAQGGFQPLERDVFGHLQRLQFYTGRLMTPFVIIILMVLVIIMFVFGFSLRKQKPNPSSL